MIDNKKLAVIIPCYNEEERIYETVKKIDNYLKRYISNYEIVVYDDGSLRPCNDIKATVYYSSVNSGKGFAVRQALKNTEADYYLITDADLSTPISELSKLMRVEDDIDLISGSRYCDDSTVTIKQSMLRRIYSRTFNRMIRIMFKIKIRDTQIGFKLLNRKARDVYIKFGFTNRYCYDVEMYLIMRENGLSAVEKGVIWNDEKPQSFTKHIPDMLVGLLKIKWRQIAGYYNDRINKNGGEVIMETSLKERLAELEHQ